VVDSLAEPLLRVENLVRRFGGITATDNLSLDVASGELHAIIGPNGAGKTTLISQLTGQLPPNSGTIRFAGREITRMPSYKRSALGLARSFQITSLLPDFTALDNVALAAQAHDGHSFYFWSSARKEKHLREAARCALARVGLEHRAEVLVSKLSHGEQRELELAVALATKPRLLLLDEPMAGLGITESARMVKLLQELRRELTIVLVEHDMEAVFALADRITVLVYGRVIASDVPAAVRSNEEVKRAYLGDQHAVTRLLEVDGIETCYGLSQVLFGMSLSVRSGEMVALMGRNGMGKTTTIRSIMGLTPARAGVIRFGGQDVRSLPSFKIAQLGIGLVPEGRQIFPNLTVRENLVAASGNRLGSPDPWTIEKIHALFPRLAERGGNMGVTLSGGEQQMLAIGRALMTNPRLLILDEATEGLAPLIREEIWNCLSMLKAKGQSVLVIDKNVENLSRIADRHTMIERGRAVWSGTSEQLIAQPDLQHRYLGI
jgi:ABC-type branched-subunit amino acid transport system ATPase component